MKQAEFIYKYNDKHREKFNKDLFIRSDDDIIEELKKIILSCQRDKFFTIKVVSFNVIENYEEINRYLYEHEENKNKNKNKGKKRDNSYDFINLKTSDIKLLVIKYYLKFKDETGYIDVIIAVPRIVDKYYFRLNGNVYSAIYQIVDASTYNNSTSNSKKHSVTLKTTFMPVRIYRNSTYQLKTTRKESLKCTQYESNIFNKTIPALKYILGKYGFDGTLKFLHLKGVIFATNYDLDNENFYTFSKHDNLFISVAKYMYDNDSVVQSMVYTILKTAEKSTTYDEILGNEFWISALGKNFNNANKYEKGLSVLDSLEKVYDITTKENIHLPEESKKDIYCILRWMIGEFSNLKIKDNLDISTKKIRISEYLASLYAAKLSNGIYRTSDLANKTDLSGLIRSIAIGPMYLISEITRCNLVNYRNMVNDTDSMTALKFTYKGISSLGNKGRNSVPDVYRTVNLSHVGRVDLDSSSPSDPGITGTICPLAKNYNGPFSEFEEPNFWETEIKKLMDNYKSTVGLKEAIYLQNSITGDNTCTCLVTESINIFKKLIVPLSHIEDEFIDTEIEIEQNGNIVYE